MRRRLSVALLTAVVVFAILLVSRYLPVETRGERAASTGSSRDSLASPDSADRGTSIDTTCLASRIGLPCNNPY